ncbi:hypothetical protein KOI35_26855 [Actinoplanes bogorensis]|uniref:Aminoglycoside phosphotransferase domain-containing protein n=1 Tax=Paractinoplanes bogorensis TaxID=1610840 RepID=A0ABS5YUK9_9ACTN|nr:phosphotransferase [Actinoplanes bogorensis]MBU2667132.1 hypothetical protein [Actinoplanes bogorensis]
MARQQWDQLPPALRNLITDHEGPFKDVQDPGAGSNADFAATLTAYDGSLAFCKGARLDTDQTGFLRNEIRLNQHLPRDLAPRLRWSAEADGWLVAAFDHVPGTSADLRPGSPDLPVIARTLTRMAKALTPCPPVNIQPATARWGRLLDPALIDGDTLLHTDMTHNNFLIADGHAQVVDWSMPCRGAIWLDTARMLVRLIRAGHTPTQAESWAAALPTWTEASPEAVDAFAAALAKLSRKLRDTSADAPHLAEMATASGAWVQHRLKQPQ